MMMRLAFSTATDIDPEVLLIDEVFASGDAEFVQKATSKMERLLDESHIVIMVSHQLDLINQMCTRAIWIDNGDIVSDGEPSEVTDKYLAHASLVGGS
jgi:lipopolysaccharide transport system ATP-binding protein